MIVSRLQGPIYSSRGPVDKSCLPTVWQTASDDHPLKLTSSRPRMIQPFVILLQLIPWLQTVTPPQEGYRDPKWSAHTRKNTQQHLHCDDKLINSLRLIGIALSCYSPADHLSWVRYRQSPFLNAERCYEMLIQRQDQYCSLRGIKWSDIAGTQCRPWALNEWCDIALKKNKKTKTNYNRYSYAQSHG